MKRKNKRKSDQIDNKKSSVEDGEEVSSKSEDFDKKSNKSDNDSIDENGRKSRKSQRNSNRQNLKTAYMEVSNSESESNEEKMSNKDDVEPKSVRKLRGHDSKSKSRAVAKNSRSSRRTETMSYKETSDVEEDDNESDDNDRNVRKSNKLEEPDEECTKKTDRKSSKRSSSLKSKNPEKHSENNEEETGDGGSEISLRSEKSDSKKQKTKPEDEEEEDENEDSTEYEVEKLLDVYFKKNGRREFLVRWKGYSSKHDTWEPEEYLNCKELIDALLKKCEKAKSIPLREMRTNRRPTDRFVVSSKGRKSSARLNKKPRKTYYDDNEDY